MTERDAPGSISRERQRDGSIRYRPRIRIEGQRQSLGLYDTEAEAEDVLAADLERPPGEDVISPKTAAAPDGVGRPPTGPERGTSGVPRGELIHAVDADWVTVQQRRFRTFGGRGRALDLLMASRWWRLEVLRAYPSSADSARYARALWSRGVEALAPRAPTAARAHEGGLAVGDDEREPEGGPGGDDVG